jgi:hypothetical protein
MWKKKGTLYLLPDGSFAVAYTREQALVKKGCAFLRIVDEALKPVKSSTGSGALATKVKDLKDIVFIKVME